MVKSLGISTHRSTFITWKKNSGEYLHNFITWQDKRAEQLVQTLNASLKFYVSIYQLNFYLTWIFLVFQIYVLSDLQDNQN